MSDLDDNIDEEIRTENRQDNVQKVYNDETSLTTIIKDILDEEFREDALKKLKENYLKTVKDWKIFKEGKDENTLVNIYKIPGLLITILQEATKVFFIYNSLKGK